VAKDAHERPALTEATPLVKRKSGSAQPIPYWSQFLTSSNSAGPASFCLQVLACLVRYCGAIRGSLLRTYPGPRYSGRALLTRAFCGPRARTGCDGAHQSRTNSSRATRYAAFGGGAGTAVLAALLAGRRPIFQALVGLRPSGSHRPSGSSPAEGRETNAQVAHGEPVQEPPATPRDLLGFGPPQPGELPLEAQPRVVPNDAPPNGVG
jgi:hypothetical protein